MMTQVRKRRPSTPAQASACCGPLDDLLDPDLFKALCDPTRVKLVACLCKCGRPCAVSEIAECCSVDLSVVSRHLQMLERAGVLVSNKEGRTMFYSVKFSHLSSALRNLADAIESCCPASSDNCKGGCCVKC